MSVIALGSVKASPGVTTSMLALAAVWPRDREVLVAEVDPDGGDVAARVGLRTDPGLSSLAAAGRRALVAGEADRHVQALPGGLSAIVGPADADQACRALQVLGGRLTLALTDRADRDVLLDCGRLRPGSPVTPLLTDADAVILVSRPRLDELQHVQARAQQLAAAGVRSELLLVGGEPYGADEVARALGLPVLGTLPDDPAPARVFSGRSGSRARLARSALVRSARGVAETLVASVAGHLDGHLDSSREASVSVPQSSQAPTDPPREPSVSGNGHGERSVWVDAAEQSATTPPPAGTR